ncbi:hypothetical protein MIM_c35240 [Advenella mimigardefordensis DPN7]|uniref:VENN motif-containing domain-containing protein n=2 Tax=Advenella mimigardefordensis TaxID=302406 RepID=W0PF12_ADVMD|nr:hypothetical protein MIM_c35240 [Advenella mimigardefordensis DPN7]
MVSSIAGLAGAGLSGAVGGNGQSFVSGGVAGRTAVENNYLTSSQLEGFAQRARNCSGESCKKVIQDMVDTNIQQQEEMMAVCSASPEQCREKYGYLVDQWDAFDTTIKRLDADKTLPGKFRDYMPAVYMLDREAASLTAEYGWTKRLEAMGLDTETAQIVAAALPSMVGMPKGRSAGNGKVGIRQPSPNVKQHKEQIAAGKNPAEAQSPSVSTKSLSSSKLSEAQRQDKKRELFDNFTGGASRTRKAQITIDGKQYTANPELSKNAPVFDGVPQGKVLQYFKDLAGIEALPTAKPMAAIDVYGNPGIRYTIDKDGLTYNLRSGSSSVDSTGAKWTIEINGLKGHEINGRILNHRRIEVKFR